MIKLEFEIEIVSIFVPLQDGQLSQFALVIPFNILKEVFGELERPKANPPNKSRIIFF